MRSEQGFSLLELLIVLVVIALIAAIAVPNLLAARRAANEGASTSALRTLYMANVNYAASTGNGSYAGTAGSVGISSLTDLANADFIDDVLGSGIRSSYSFVGDRTLATATQPETFYFSTNPAISSGLLSTGSKRFGVATNGLIHLDATPANLGIPFDALTIAAAPVLAN
jgi:prepilin-type N-terminal cleavage/methylation domain-containing protein